MPVWLGDLAPVVTASVPVLLGVIGLVRYWMRLRFLRHVFDRGDRHDLKIAGKVCEPQGLTSALARRVRGRHHDSDT